MPANSDTTFWTDLGYTARRPFRTLTDYEHWIAQMRDIPRYFHEEMDEMRAGMKRGFTPAARHHGGPRCLDHRGHRGDARRRACSIPRSATCRAFPPRDRRACGRRPSRSSATWCSRPTRSCCKFMRTEYVPAHAHHARRRGAARRPGLLPREDPRIHHPRHGARRDPQLGVAEVAAAARGDGRAPCTTPASRATSRRS